MLEVKDKNLSAVKCILCTAEKGTIKALEQEWGRYKYAVLERSPGEYQKIRTLLKDKTAYPAAAFYRAIEHAYAQPIADGNRVNAAQHVWGYFRNTANEKEKDRFFRSAAVIPKRLCAGGRAQTVLVPAGKEV
jgi:UV DNA damage endonuclease